MIDWHSHVLPKVDDGSQSVEESLTLLKALRSQGVGTVVATPHFNANEESVASFLQRRDESYRILSSQLDGSCPEILLGAEVRYYAGIGRLKELSLLTIGDTRLLLLEMPFSRWTEYILRELEEISCRGALTVVLAHVERYLSYQSEDTLLRLEQNGILMQVNASFFTDFFQKRKALRMLRERRIHLLGSDCHDIKHRPPALDKACQTISKYLGEDFIRQINEQGDYLLSQNRNIF